MVCQPHTREDILSAAKEVFIAKGLESTTMDEIAEKAEDHAYQEN